MDIDTYRNKWWIMVAVSLTLFMGAVDGTIVNVALPTLAAEFNARFAVGAVGGAGLFAGTERVAAGAMGLAPRAAAHSPAGSARRFVPQRAPLIALTNAFNPDHQIRVVGV